MPFFMHIIMNQEKERVSRIDASAVDAHGRDIIALRPDFLVFPRCCFEVLLVRFGKTFAPIGQADKTRCYTSTPLRLAWPR